MANHSGKTPSRKQFRVWPGVVFPVGLSLLLVLAGWQFSVGVQAEQDRRDAADRELAGRARAGARDLSSRARELAQSFLDRRLAARAEQERGLHVEIRGVMEAVNRVLGASLERGRAQGGARREVSAFPSGFGSLRNYLELSPRPGSGPDQPVKALHACAPELGALLPAGCSLAVIENNAVEIFSIGGGAPAGDGVSVSMNREFIWSDGGGEGRRWTLALRLHAPDLHPLPEAGEIARHLAVETGGADLGGIVWRGWLVGANGQPVAAFPAEGAGVPFTGRAGEWVETDSLSRVWLESGARMTGFEAAPAVAVSIARPAPPLDLAEEFLGDTRWIFTLGALALGALAFWIWFVRGLAGSGRRRLAELEAEVEAEAVPVKSRRRAEFSSPGPAGAEAVAAELRRRLVRDERVRASSVADVEGVIVADIAADGGMTVSSVSSAPRAAPLPSGSLFRLQARHRGGKGRAGARALDRATHPVLKTLAERIRPVVNVNANVNAGAAQAVQAQTSSRPRGRATERLAREE